MAGSYNHCVTNAGNLMSNERMMIKGAMIENLGDAYEAIEEMFGMIWYLADQIADSSEGAAAIAKATTAKLVVEVARNNYKKGLEISKQVHRDSPDNQRGGDDE